VHAPIVLINLSSIGRSGSCAPSTYIGGGVKTSTGTGNARQIPSIKPGVEGSYSLLQDHGADFDYNSLGL